MFLPGRAGEGGGLQAFEPCLCGADWATALAQDAPGKQGKAVLVLLPRGGRDQFFENEARRGEKWTEKCETRQNSRQ